MSWSQEDDDVEMHMLLLSRPRATVDSAERNSPPASQCGAFTATSEFEEGCYSGDTLGAAVRIRSAWEPVWRFYQLSWDEWVRDAGAL